MCMKRPYMFLTLLILGPKGLSNDIDVYMQPLIYELKELWENGACTYDASLKENFQMRAAILWKINDFPAYGYISCWSTKGKLACPCCCDQTTHLRLEHGRKIFYMGHRHFLPRDHRWHKQKTQFDGKVEKRDAPNQPSGVDSFNQLIPLKPITFGKALRKQQLTGYGKLHNWKKHSIFFELPY